MLKYTDLVKYFNHAQTRTNKKAPVAHKGTGQINGRVECRAEGEFTAKTGDMLHDGWRTASTVDRTVRATCFTVEHVGRGSRGGGERGVLGQEAEGRGEGYLAIGAVVLSGDAGNNGVFHGNGTFG